MGCELPRVTRCFFCFNLRTGAILIGYLSILHAIIGVIFKVVSICLVYAYVAKNTRHPPAGHTAEEVWYIGLSLYVLLSLSLSVHIFYFVISLLLVVGVHTRRPRYMKYFFIAGMVNLILNLVVVAVGFMFVAFGTTAAGIASCIVKFYCLLVIRSAYLEMEEQRKPVGREMTIYNTQQIPLMT